MAQGESLIILPTDGSTSAAVIVGKATLCIPITVWMLKHIGKCCEASLTQEREMTTFAFSSISIFTQTNNLTFLNFNIGILNLLKRKKNTTEPENNFLQCRDFQPKTSASVWSGGCSGTSGLVGGWVLLQHIGQRTGPNPTEWRIERGSLTRFLDNSILIKDYQYTTV